MLYPLAVLLQLSVCVHAILMGFAVMFIVFAWENGGGGWEFSHRHKNTVCVYLSMCPPRPHREKERMREFYYEKL